MANPRVSVICIFYNSERFLGEAIDSVLAQDFQDFELLLVDDGSADRSRGIASDHAGRDPGRIRYLEHDGRANLGMSATRNLGLKEARGEFVTFIDSDDAWRPTKLSEQVAILDRDPRVGMVSGAINYWRSWKGGRDRVVPTGNVANGAIFPPQTSLALYPLGRAPNPSGALMRRDIVERVGGYEERFRGLYEDQAFWSKMYLETGIYFSTSVWLDYRQHPGSCTARTGRDERRRHRRAFLDWFENYLSKRQVSGKELIERAVARARWGLENPGLDRLRRFGRRVRGGLR